MKNPSVGQWGDYAHNPAYHEVTGAEGEAIAAQFGQEGAIVLHGEYTICDGHVYTFEMPEGMGYDPIFTDWVHHPRVTGHK